MGVLKPSNVHPGRWRLGEYELREGDVLDVQIGAEWRRVDVRFHGTLNELRLFAAHETLPIAEDTRAWLVRSGGD